MLPQTGVIGVCVEYHSARSHLVMRGVNQLSRAKYRYGYARQVIISPSIIITLNPRFARENRDYSVRFCVDTISSSSISSAA